MGFPITVYSDDDGAFKSNVKDFVDGERITHITTRAHANVAERFIKTLKSAIHDRVRNTDRQWQDMLPYVLTKYKKRYIQAQGTHQMTVIKTRIVQV